MREYSCIIVDDESTAIEVLKDTLLDLYPAIKVTGTYTNWKEAVIALKRNKVDILFLDISMPEKTGFDMLSFLPDLSSEIVFVTAHPEFAMDAFQYMASGYLLKPVDDIALQKTIQRVIARIDAKADNGTRSLKKVVVPDSRGLDYVEEDDILYLEAAGKHTRVVTFQKEYISTQPFGTFCSTLSYHPFYQVHRSFVVNMKTVVRYETTGILILKNNATIPIAKNWKEVFLEQFGKMK